MNRIIIIVIDYNWRGFQNIILLGLIEEVNEALQINFHMYINGFIMSNHKYKILLDKYIHEDISIIKNKINCLNSQKQVLFFYDITKGFSFTMDKPYDHPSLYWFGYRQIYLDYALCKHNIQDRCDDCYKKEQDEMNLLQISDTIDRHFIMAIYTITNFISELNLPVEPLWVLAAKRVKLSGINVNKANATDYAIQAVNEYYPYDYKNF